MTDSLAPKWALQDAQESWVAQIRMSLSKAAKASHSRNYGQISKWPGSSKAEQIQVKEAGGRGAAEPVRENTDFQAEDYMLGSEFRTMNQMNWPTLWNNCLEDCFGRGRTGGREMDLEDFVIFFKKTVRTVWPIGRAEGTGETPKARKEENLVTGWPRGKEGGEGLSSYLDFRLGWFKTKTRAGRSGTPQPSGEGRWGEEDSESHSLQGGRHGPTGASVQALQ